MSDVRDLGRLYGKALALVQEDEDLFVVNEVDRDGLVVAQWSSGRTRKDAIAGAEQVLRTLFREQVADDDARGALLGMARMLPSDVLRQVLLERGDWNIEVPS